MRALFRSRAPAQAPPVEAAGSHPLDEAALVAQAMQNPLAFAPLYLRYLDPVHQYCYRRLGTREAAEDATSQIFERVLKALPTYRGGLFRAWLFTIAHNVVTDSYRGARPHEPLAAAEEVPDPTPEPETVTLLADERRLLQAALPLLPADQRRVMELRLGGLPATDVATILGRTPESVRTLQTRPSNTCKPCSASPSPRRRCAMPDRRDLPLDLTLDRFWDEVFRGEPAGSDLEPLDPGLAATVRRVHALETAPPADPVFASRLWEDLMHAQGIAGSISLRPTPPPAGPTAHARPAPRPRPLFGAPDSRRRWALAQAGLAAIVLIALIGLCFAFRPTEHPAVVNPTPVPATPVGTPVPAFADVPNYKADAGRTGVNPGPGPTGQPVEIWRADLGADLRSSPAIVAGVLYAGGGDGKLHALDAATGAERWTFSTGGPIATSPTVAGGLVFIGSSDGDLYAVDAATGTQRWSLP
ncbi:MAG TPA: sigma-70 family RNA polymerase sigma factor, partial [Thermomicrobiales bacterium]